jgi:folate-binding protein YgfZ
VIVDQSSWGHIRLTGADRIRFLNGMCSIDVGKLAEGDWRRAVMLNVKGRVTSIYDIVHRGDHLLLICEPSLRERTVELLRKHAIMDDVDIEPTATQVHRVWSDPEAVWSAPPVFGAPPQPPAGDDAVEVRRIEAGLPRYGIDVGEDHFPFESLLGRCVDYEKGCYLGQEPVYRVHAKGNPARQMRGLRIDGDGPVAPGTVVVHPARAEAGTITSAAMSPGLGSIGLAYLHRSVFAPGGEVTVAGRRATVVELPFAGDPGSGEDG